jgi:hypothetical protein
LESLEWKKHEAVLAVLGLALVIVVAFLGETSIPPPMTDLERNMHAIEARSRGISPIYAQLADLEPVPLDPEVSEWWVAQSPLAVASAVLPAQFGGITVAQYRWIAWSILLTAGALLGWILPKPRRWVVPWVLGATAVSAGWQAELAWVNGQVITTLGLVVFLILGEKGRVTLSSGLLGVLIAWRPWLLPVVAFRVPTGMFRHRLVLVGFTGAGITVAAALFLGGWSVLADFLRANAANISQYRTSVWNLSLTKSLPAVTANIVFAGAAVSAMWLVIRGHRRSASILALAVIGGVGIMIWSHYWIPLLFLMFAMTSQRDYFNVALIAGALLVISGLFVQPSVHRTVYSALVALFAVSAYTNGWVRNAPQ